MAFFERNLPAGIVMGVAAGYAAREVFPALGPIVRPVTKTVVKGAILGYEKIKEAFATVGESFEDLASEVRTELHTNGGARREGAAAEETATGRKKARKETEAEARQAG